MLLVALGRDRTVPCGLSAPEGGSNAGLADIDAVCRADAVEDALGEAAACRCNEVVLSGEAGARLPLALTWPWADSRSVPVRGEACAFC